MADNVSKFRRSIIMSKIKSHKTKPELIVKRFLKGKGFIYQPKIIGKPDFVSTKQKIAIFVHGCFWHGCKKHCRMPSSNKEYWKNKIEKNVKRDKRNKRLLISKEFKVIIIWEHELAKDKLKRLLKARKI